MATYCPPAGRRLQECALKKPCQNKKAAIAELFAAAGSNYVFEILR